MAGVTVRVEGKQRTLLSQTAPLAGLSKVMRGGHSCAATSAAAALQLATHGSWSGPWSSKYSDFEVTKIKGETNNYSTTKSYWEVLVNNVPASTGICNLKLTGDANVVFAALGASEKPGLPLGIATANAHEIKVVAYSAKGTPSPLAGASVTINGKSAGKTNAQGVVSTAGQGFIVVSKTGYIRYEEEVQS
jgi:hypothetical protein